MASELGRIVGSPIGEVQGIPAYSIKVESHCPRRTPSIAGFVHLFEAKSGQLLALLESSFISGVGSALTNALATDLLASPSAKTLSLVGTGAQGWLVLRFLMEMRVVEEVRLFDLNRGRSLRTAERLRKYEALRVVVCDSLNEAVSSSDMICCATWSEEPFLFPEMIKPGAHVTTIGSDLGGKREVSVELLRGSSFFCDDRVLALRVGALEGVENGSGLIRGELGELLSGKVPGRRDSVEVTVYGAVGLPFVDLVAGWETYRRALKKQDGSSMELLS